MILVYSSITSTKKKHSIILILFLVLNLIILVIPAILIKSALGSAFVITEGWYTRLQSLQGLFNECADATMNISDIIVEQE
jgi:hypothetical protein